MADNETPEQPTEPVPAPAAVAAPQVLRLRDHLFTFRSVIAVALATLLLGGAGGAALVALTTEDHDHVRFSRFGERPDRDGNGPQFPYGPGGGMPQQMQPNFGSNR